MPKAKRARMVSLTTLQPNAAGADIGAREIYVAVPPDRSTPWCAVSARSPISCAPSSSGCASVVSIRWRWRRPVCIGYRSERLEEVGLAVCLGNPRPVTNVPGRKTDGQDCQWLHYLHAVGRLLAAFRASAEVRPIRVLSRHRDAFVRQSAWRVQPIHKAFDQMNVQIHHVIADITGATGTGIVEAMLAGQRDPAHLAGAALGLKQPRIQP